MPRHAAATTLPQIDLDRRVPVPLRRQIYLGLRAAILIGQLPTRTRLPSVVSLAGHLGVARNTIADAYAQLQAEGYLVSKVGSGTIVAPGIPERPLPIGDTDPLGSVPQPDLPAWQGPPVTGDPPPLRPGVPALDRFPYETWARLIAHHARHSLRAVAAYQDPAGYPPLRAAIAAHLAVSRGVRCTPEQVIITSGSQGALDLTARALLRGGDRVWLEEPGNPGARGAFLSAGADLMPIPIDAEGLVVSVGVARDPQARLAYVTPAHQFPLGVAMSVARRLALLAWARERHAWIIEEDYDSEYRFRGRPLTALQALDHAGRVTYVGTFSRILFPALRVGYLVIPPDLIDAFVTTRRYIDRHPPILEQLALTDFIARGHLARHVRRMRTIYAARGAALVDAVAAECGERLDIRMPESGLHAIGWLRPEMDDRVAARRANHAGIGVLPLSAFALEPLARGGLVIGYGAVSEGEMRAVVRSLAHAIR
ncbi:MAG: MocR-like pyridoxine biosynthesis transcription factor PdxR [Thermomicrobiales bacterium]